MRLFWVLAGLSACWAPREGLTEDIKVKAGCRSECPGSYSGESASKTWLSEVVLRQNPDNRMHVHTPNYPNSDRRVIWNHMHNTSPQSCWLYPRYSLIISHYHIPWYCWLYTSTAIVALTYIDHVKELGEEVIQAFFSLTSLGGVCFCLGCMGLWSLHLISCIPSFIPSSPG